MKAEQGTPNDLINRIMYLSSLASRRQDIEPMLDTLRIVTASWKPGDAMGGEDQSKLENLESQIKKYLVTEDPLRSFTLESLEERLKAKSGKRLKPAINGFLGTVLASLAAGAAVFLLPLPLEIKERVWLGTFVAFVALHIGIARFYITALKNFKSEFRQAYIYLAAAAIVLSVAFAHFLIINLLELYRFDILRYSGITGLFSLAFILIYLGLRKYANLLRIKTPFTSLWVATGLAVLTGAVVWFLPHRSVPEPLYFHISSVGTAMLPVFSLLGAALAYKIKQTVTPAYGRSVKWLYLYTLVVGLGSFSGQAAFHYFGELYGEHQALIMILFGITPQLVMLYSSYLFKKETGK